jgi:hypothetical protein
MSPAAIRQTLLTLFTAAALGTGLELLLLVSSSGAKSESTSTSRKSRGLRNEKYVTL